MTALFLPENAWQIEVAGQDLQIGLVRTFMGKHRVLSTVPVPGFAAASEPEKREKLIEALGKQGRTARAFLRLSRDQGIVRELQLPIDLQHDLKSALTLQIEAISAWPEQDVYWDYRVEKAKENPKMLQVTVVVIPKSILDPWLRLFEAANIPLSGATVEGFDVNAIPPHLRRQSARAQVIVTYALASCVLVLGAAFLVRDPYQQRVYASQIQQEFVRVEPQVKDLVHQEGELDALTKRHQALLKQLQQGDSNLEALKTLAVALPPDTFVLSYRYQSEVVTISGVSNSSLDVQNALETSPVFKDVQFAAPITREASGKDRFTLKMAIEAKP